MAVKPIDSQRNSAAVAPTAEGGAVNLCYLLFNK